MTTQPGVLPPNIEKLRYERLPGHIKTFIDTLGYRMLQLDQRIKDEAKQQKTIEVLDKTELAKLNQGAEDTSTEEEEESDEDRVKPARTISSSMQRSIDRLLKASDKKDKNQKIID